MANRSIVHVDFPAKDPKSAAEFYASLFGWGVRHDDTFDYWMFETEHERGGGFVSTEGGPSPLKVGEIMVYVGTDDIDGDLVKAESLGAKITMPKTELPGVGWMATFADPTGNNIGLFEYLPTAA